MPRRRALCLDKLRRPATTTMNHPPPPRHRLQDLVQQDHRSREQEHRRPLDFPAQLVLLLAGIGVVLLGMRMEG